MTQVGVTSRNENDNPGELQAGSGIGGTPRQVGRVVRPVEVRKPGESQHNVATLQDEAAGRRVARHPGNSRSQTPGTVRNLEALHFIVKRAARNSQPSSGALNRAGFVAENMVDVGPLHLFQRPPVIAFKRSGSWIEEP